MTTGCQLPKTYGIVRQMKLEVVLLLACLVGFVACSKKPAGITPDRVTPGPEGKWLLDGKPWSGKHVDKFPNDKTSFEGDLIEGRPHGAWTWYFENGKTKSRLVYALGIKDGNETHYYNNANNTRMWVKTWKRGAFVKSYQWQKDGTPVLPELRTGVNSTIRALP